VDDVENRKVSKEEMDAWISKRNDKGNLKYFEVSSKTKQGLDTLFDYVSVIAFKLTSPEEEADSSPLLSSKHVDAEEEPATSDEHNRVLFPSLEEFVEVAAVAGKEIEEGWHVFEASAVKVLEVVGEGIMEVAEKAKEDPVVRDALVKLEDFGAQVKAAFEGK